MLGQANELGSMRIAPIRLKMLEKDGKPWKLGSGAFGHVGIRRKCTLDGLMAYQIDAGIL